MFPTKKGYLNNGSQKIGYVTNATKTFPLFVTRINNRRKFLYHISYTFNSSADPVEIPVKISNNDSDEAYDGQEIFITELNENFKVKLYDNVENVLY